MEIKSNNYLKIEDLEFVFSEKIIFSYLNDLQECILIYNKTICDNLEEAFEDELISANINLLLDSMNKIKENINEISENLDGKIKNFIKNIDEKDKFIY